MRTTVIVPAYRAWATLPTVLAALRPQIEEHDREAILIESSGEVDEDSLRARWPWLTVLALPTRTRPGPARNLGLRAAQGELIAFLDADGIPEPTWLDELERALTPEKDAVAGVIVNGTPRSAVGTAGYFLEFSEWLPARRDVPLHGATCNLLVRREALERAGGFDDIWPGEDTILTVGLSQRGALAFAPGGRVRHVNRTRLVDFVGHQRLLGSGFVAVCRRVPFPYGFFSRPIFAPVAGLLRLVALTKRLRHKPGDLGRALLVSPLLALGLAAWTVGVVAGARGAET